MMDVLCDKHVESFMNNVERLKNTVVVVVDDIDSESLLSSDTASSWLADTV